MGAEKGRYALIVAEEQMPRHTGACLVYVTPKGVATELNHVALFLPLSPPPKPANCSRRVRLFAARAQATPAAQTVPKPWPSFN